MIPNPQIGLNTSAPPHPVCTGMQVLEHPQNHSPIQLKQLFLFPHKPLVHALEQPHGLTHLPQVAHLDPICVGALHEPLHLDPEHLEQHLVKDLPVPDPGV